MARTPRTRWRRDSSARGGEATTRRCTKMSTAPPNGRSPHSSWPMTTGARCAPRPRRERSCRASLATVPVGVRTRLFGTLRLAFALRIAGGGSGGIAWSRSLEFPGLRTGEVLSRRMALPHRATLLARDGSILAEGAATEAGQRDSPLGALAGAALGEVGPVPSARAAQLEAEGVPADAIVGVSGI